MATPAGRVSRLERERAIKRNADTAYAAAIGANASTRIIREIRRIALLRARRNVNIQPRLERLFRDLGELLLQGMMYSRLRGVDREVKDLRQTASSANTRRAEPRLRFDLSPTYRRAMLTMIRRLRATPEQLVEMRDQMEPNVVDVLTQASERAQVELQRTIAETTAAQLTFREGRRAVQETLDRLGITQGPNNLAETIFRTQTQLAYAAGNAQITKDPDIEEILWGWKYVTVGDDRVRDAHIPLDGVQLPKSDPFWKENKPPNGYNCRCQAIPIYEERRPVFPPDSAHVVLPGGTEKQIQVGPDTGFKFDPGDFFPPV